MNHKRAFRRRSSCAWSQSLHLLGRPLTRRGTLRPIPLRSKSAGTLHALTAPAVGAPTSAPGSLSSAKPASPSTTEGPTRWGTPPSRPARGGGLIEVPSAVGLAGPWPERLNTVVAASSMVCQPVQRHRWASRALIDLLGGDRRVTGRRSRPPGLPGRIQGGQAHDDARGAEPALASTCGHQRLRPAAAADLRESIESGDLPAPQPTGRGYTGHPRDTVHPHGAAAALPLRAAAVLDRPDTQLLPKDVEEPRRPRRRPRRRRRRRAAGSGGDQEIS